MSGFNWKRFNKLDKVPLPCGHIQWKGTDVCIDLDCICGAHSHYDGDFLYFFKCWKCDRRFAVGSAITLHEIDDIEVIEDIETGHGFKTDTDYE